MAPAVQAAGEHGLPELRPVPAPHDLRERGVRPPPPEGQGRRDQAAGSRTCSSLVELPGFEQRKPTQISGGQAQRVALARALINRPAVLLLDEPLGALDLKLRKQMQVELKRIQQEVGITFIYVTHDQEEAMTMSRPHRRHEQGPLRAAGRPRGALRAADDAVRRRLPRRQQPARRRVPRAPPTGWRSSSSATGPSSGRRPTRSTAARPSTSASARRRSGSTRTATRRPDGHNHLTGVVDDASYLGCQHPVHRRDPRRRPGHGLRAEHRANDEGGAVGAAATRSISPGPGPHLRGARPGARRSAGPAGRVRST